MCVLYLIKNVNDLTFLCYVFIIQISLIRVMNCQLEKEKIEWGLASQATEPSRYYLT